MANEIIDSNTAFKAHRATLDNIVGLATAYQEAPEKEKCALLEKWGGLIAHHLDMELHGLSPLFALDDIVPTTLADDVLRSVGQFFDALQTQLMVLPWPYTPQGVPRHPGLRGLVAILDVADKNTSGSPTLNCALTSGIWDPAPLLGILLSTQRLQQDSDPQGTRRWQNIPFWRCTQMLAIAAITSEWVPPPEYGPKMWYVPLFHKFPRPEQAFAILADKLPHSFSAALEYYLSESSEHMNSAMIERMFAMDWSKTNDKIAVQMLLEMIYDHNLDDAYPDGMRCFQLQHPDLFAAFQIQASLFNDSQDAEKYTQACLPGWNQAIHGAGINTLPLPELGLESP